MRCLCLTLHQREEGELCAAIQAGMAHGVDLFELRLDLIPQALVHRVRQRWPHLPWLGTVRSKEQGGAAVHYHALWHYYSQFAWTWYDREYPHQYSPQKMQRILTSYHIQCSLAQLPSHMEKILHYPAPRKVVVADRVSPLLFAHACERWKEKAMLFLGTEEGEATRWLLPQKWVYCGGLPGQPSLQRALFLRQATTFYGLIGTPLQRSPSFRRLVPWFFRYNPSYGYLALPVTPDILPAALTYAHQRHFLGLSVTAPLKRCLQDMLQVTFAEPTPGANTLVWRPEGWLAYDYDGKAVYAAVEERGWRPKSLTMYGWGGAAQSIQHAFAALPVRVHHRQRVWGVAPLPTLEVNAQCCCHTFTAPYSVNMTYDRVDSPTISGEEIYCRQAAYQLQKWLGSAVDWRDLQEEVC